MRRQSDALLLLPLLPIFVIGMFPMLLIGLLGFFGLGIFGVLLVCVGLASGLEARSDFIQDVIVHGRSRGSERAVRPSELHSAIRLGALLIVTGALLIVVSIVGLFRFG